MKGNLKGGGEGEKMVTTIDTVSVDFVTTDSVAGKINRLQEVEVNVLTTDSSPLVI